MYCTVYKCTIPFAVHQHLGTPGYRRSAGLQSPLMGLCIPRERGERMLAIYNCYYKGGQRGSSKTVVLLLKEILSIISRAALLVLVRLLLLVLLLVLGPIRVIFILPFSLSSEALLALRFQLKRFRNARGEQMSTFVNRASRSCLKFPLH